MRRIRIDDHQESLILTGLIVSTAFIRDAEPILDIRLFQSDYSPKIAKWCLDYFKENRKAPGIHIEDIYAQKVEDGEIEETEAQLIAKVLERVSKDYERSESFNHDYLLKVARKFFSSREVAKECRLILDLVDKDPLEAARRMESFKAKELPSSQGYSVLKDRKLIRRAFEERQKPIFRMPGALGEMVNPDLCRQNFIGMLGMEKIGKTWNLLEFALTAARQRLNVAFFQAGDMTDTQQTARIGIRLTGKSDKRKYCGEILVPIYDCAWNQDDSCDRKRRKSKIGLGINEDERKEHLCSDNWKKMDFFKELTDDGYKACDICRKERPRDYAGAVWYRLRKKVMPLTWKEAALSAAKFYKRMRGRDIKLHSSSGDLSITKIESILDYWERTENFIADVILTDYADLFVSGINQDFRHQTNQIWKDHRFLSQRRNALVITATQADAEAYGKRKLELSNFSEDKRKYAHVTAFYAMNQTYEEKVMGIMRMSHLVVRDDDFDPRKEVKILRCLPIGRPILGSYL
jgi:hypothetical protein